MGTKIEGMKRYKARRKILHNLYFYLVTAFACSLLCCFSLYLFSVDRVLLSSKLFILGNLIIIVLIVDSRICSSNSSIFTNDVCYEDYMKSSQTQKPAIKKEEYKVAEDDEQGSEGATLVDAKKPEENIEPCDSDTEELNRRADDYIARVNRQRRLEVQLSLVQCQCGSY